MWVFTPRGFYSAVEKPEDREDGMVTVRARAKADLDRLSDLIDAKPYRKTYSDYPWRIRCTKDAWASAMYQMSQEIDYPNFKDRIKATLGAARANVYSRVWGVLLDVESKRKPKRAKSPARAANDGKCRCCGKKEGTYHARTCRWSGFRVAGFDCSPIDPPAASRSLNRSVKKRRVKA